MKLCTSLRSVSTSLRSVSTSTRIAGNLDLGWAAARRVVVVHEHVPHVTEGAGCLLEVSLRCGEPRRAAGSALRGTKEWREREGEMRRKRGVGGERRGERGTERERGRDGGRE
eukprot:2024589-Rhodomonas_salina.1